MGNVHKFQGRLLPYTNKPESRKYLHIHRQGQSTKFEALQFSLSTAPMEFMPVVKVAKLMAQNKGIRIHQYLDNWLVRATSHQTFLHYTKTLVALCGGPQWPSG